MLPFRPADTGARSARKAVLQPDDPAKSLSCRTPHLVGSPTACTTCALSQSRSRRNFHIRSLDLFPGCRAGAQAAIHRADRCDASCSIPAHLPPKAGAEHELARRTAKDFPRPPPCRRMCRTSHRQDRYAPGGRVVGAERFELPTLCSQSRCATRLRYAPTAPVYAGADDFGRGPFPSLRASAKQASRPHVSGLPRRLRLLQ